MSNKYIIKFMVEDEEISTLQINREDVDRVKDLLNECRQLDDYDWDTFEDLLQANNIDVNYVSVDEVIIF